MGMHVVDVNSGHKMASNNQEEAAMKVNLEAAAEIARQLRLRNIGGIIIIDFIDMRNKDNRSELTKAMRAHMKKDRAQHTILPLSKFGLMQITRQREKQEIKINTSETCPTCNGTGKINPSILLTDEIERDMRYIFSSHPKIKLTLKVHPYIEAYLKKGIKSIQVKWWLAHQKWIKIVADQNYHLTQYTFFDEHDEEIRLN